MASPGLQNPRGIYAMRGFPANMSYDVFVLPMCAVSSADAFYRAPVVHGRFRG